MLTNCLAACAHLTITVSETERDIGRKSPFFHTPLHSTSPLGGFPSENRHPVWYGKLEWLAWLPDGEKISKISLFVLTWSTNVTDARTDRRTPGDSIYRAYAYASRGKNRTATIILILHNFTNSQISLIILAQRYLIQFSTDYDKKFLISLEPAVWFP